VVPLRLSSRTDGGGSRGNHSTRYPPPGGRARRAHGCRDLKMGAGEARGDPFPRSGKLGGPIQNDQRGGAKGGRIRTPGRLTGGRVGGGPGGAHARGGNLGGGELSGREGGPGDTRRKGEIDQADLGPEVLWGGHFRDRIRPARNGKTSFESFGRQLFPTP